MKVTADATGQLYFIQSMGKKPHAKHEVVRYALLTLMDNAITQWRQLLLGSWQLNE